MRFFSRLSPVVVFVTLLFCSQILLAQTASDPRPNIYSKIKCCACGVVFEKCDCKEALEMKGYIGALLDSNISQEDIFYKVAKKYSPDVIIDEKTKAVVEARLIKEAGENRPQIAIDPTLFNFGKISKAQGRIMKVFKLYNKGASDLIITNIRVSCSCVIASLKVNENKSPDFGIMGARNSGWQETIKPGRTGDLEVVLDLAHPSMAIGKEIRDIFVASNDPIYPQVTIRVEAEVTD